MVQIEIPNEYGYVSEEIVNQLEKELNIRFPLDYRKFLIENNGGHPDHDVFVIKDRGENCIRYFYGITNVNYCGIKEAIQVRKDRIPQNTIPIACDNYDNEIIMGVSKEENGKIFFWDHEEENEDDGSNYHENVYKCSDSFSHFWNSLKKNDEYDAPIQI